jgi:DNA-binding MarR family transcriptional regulator
MVEPEWIFLHETPCKILKLLRQTSKPIYPTIVSKKIGITYAHVFNVLLRLEEIGFVNFEKKGRIKLIQLTESGHRASEILDDFVSLTKLSHVWAGIQKISSAPEMKNSKEATRLLTKYEKELNNLKESKVQWVKDTAEKLLAKIQELKQ